MLDLKKILSFFDLSDSNSYSFNWKKCITGLTIILGLVSVLAINFRSSSYTRYVAVMGFQNPQVIMRYHAETDNIYKPETTNGNVLIKFTGFDSANQNYEDFASKAYFRANYLLFPNRTYVHESTTIINNGKDIIESHFNPNKEWFIEHNIKHIVDYHFHPDGQITSTIFDLQEN